MKIASEKADAKKIFIIDEPTNGLHLADISRIIELFDSMVEAGSSVILIEHDLEVLKAADWVIEVGPYGGKQGGEILFAGRPADLLECKSSITAKYLRESLPL
ncbi:MAG: hypothetical protein Q4P72_03655 [Eubacteriales bacterium]|nr:hypothetical protein [Eubacteriales bacterium]